MAKQKYRFDPETLTYKEESSGWAKKIVKVVFTQLSLSVVIGAIFATLAYTFIPSPALRHQKRENQRLRMAYQDMSAKLKSYSAVLDELQIRDDNIYRNILEAEPIPKSVRNAGIGGINRYEKYEGMDNRDLVTNVATRIDDIGKKIYVQTKSYEEVIELMKKKDEMRSKMPAIIPVESANHTNIGSSFGKRMHPILKVMRMHEGVDITAKTGTNVYAAGDGKVIEAGWGNGYGYHVIIDHGFNYKTVYAHLSKINIKKYQQVARGEVIGLVGNTGTSTCPHLHYEIRKNNVPVNPVNYWIGGVTTDEYQKIIEASNRHQQSLD